MLRLHLCELVPQVSENFEVGSGIIFQAVDPAAQLLNFIEQGFFRLIVSRTQQLGALKQHVFQQMGNPLILQPFVGRTDPKSDIGTHGRKIPTLKQQHR